MTGNDSKGTIVIPILMELLVRLARLTSFTYKDENDPGVLKPNHKEHKDCRKDTKILLFVSFVHRRLRTDSFVNFVVASLILEDKKVLFSSK